jgi:hypothetical protein
MSQKTMSHCPACGEVSQSTIFPFCEPCRIQLAQEADSATSDGGYLSYPDSDA